MNFLFFWRRGKMAKKTHQKISSFPVASTATITNNVVTHVHFWARGKVRTDGGIRPIMTCQICGHYEYITQEEYDAL
jgi:hypothetical protein